LEALACDTPCRVFPGIEAEYIVIIDVRQALGVVIPDSRHGLVEVAHARPEVSLAEPAVYDQIRTMEYVIFLFGQHRPAGKGQVARGGDAVSLLPHRGRR